MADVAEAVGQIASAWREQRTERQQRRHLDRADFDQLRDAGLLRMIAPVKLGGLWDSSTTSSRPLCETYRRLASGDPSVALVSTMHPAVISFWLMSPDLEQEDWEKQRVAVFASAVDGDQWGTITSEPGSGGDIGKTKAVATPAAHELALVGSTYSVAGDKHFGSGSGVAHWMMTTAVAEGETEPSIFALDVRDRPWDGSAGLRLVAEWDGVGMAATQSHAMRLDGAPAVRMAFDGPIETITRNAGPLVATLFTAVVVGILDEAIATARGQLGPRAESLRAYERVEWARAEQDHWLAGQAFEGAVRAIESGDATVAFHAALRAKEAVADLAEAVMLRVTRVLGGGTFSRRSPFAHWFEDVRALGFLRPPWGLAYDGLFGTSFGSPV